ncbi:GntR family transcriptional regulator [Paracoccus aerodenitrificans]|uniref:GntR family transcriptional regulator n=1 Tax=Paracoccus aerodenitrificans TaxID=3017781 RepID=UPI0022F020F6|nr:GntR family transcriptional regulator [Paracoccus aerodenitrificans]WBU65511.1 GntR family transcriptional regulator [Paracoccus aerodenitrificans]
METHTPLPIYRRLSEMLARDIAAGHLLDGARLPPERQMAANMGTSVGTLRKALGELERQGLLERRQGSGNYIRARPDAQNIYAFFRIELLAGGGLPTARLLSVDRLAKPEDLPEFGRSDDAYRIRRLRFLNDIPCVVEEIWLDASYTRSMAPRDLSESLYLYYRERLNLWITQVEDRISVARLPDWSPPDLGIARHEPAGYYERLSFDQENRSAEFSRNWFDTAKARYVARIR